MKEGKEQNFDVFAETYRDAHTQNIHAVSGTDSYYFAEYKVKELLRFEQNRAAMLLDLGCGDGATEVFFEQYFPAFSIEGIDVSAKSIEEAQKKQLQQARFSTYNGTTIPFEDNQFDLVFVAGVLHHISIASQLSVVQEIFRVLKPGGRLYLFEHNPINPLTQYLVNTCAFDEGVELLYSHQTKRLLKQSGFRIQHLLFTIFFPRKNFFKSLIRLEKWMSWLPLGGQYYFCAVKD